MDLDLCRSLCLNPQVLGLQVCVTMPGMEDAGNSLNPPQPRKSHVICGTGLYSTENHTSLLTVRSLTPQPPLTPPVSQASCDHAADFLYRVSNCVSDKNWDHTD